MSKAKLPAYSLDELKDEFIGKRGTKSSVIYEYELNMAVLGHMNMTQEQLGKLIGVQKAQISKLESSVNSATIDTIVKIFKALNADIHVKVKLENRYLQLT